MIYKTLTGNINRPFAKYPNGESKGKIEIHRDDPDRNTASQYHHSYCGCDPGWSPAFTSRTAKTTDIQRF